MVDKDFIVWGVKQLVKLFRKRVCIERVFSRAKEWLLSPYPRRINYRDRNQDQDESEELNAIMAETDQEDEEYFW
jgi:hypothetical protein